MESAFSDYIIKFSLFLFKVYKNFIDNNKYNIFEDS